MNGIQDFILRGTIRSLKAKGWPNANVRLAIQALAQTLNPPPVNPVALTNLLAKEGV